MISFVVVMETREDSETWITQRCFIDKNRKIQFSGKLLLLVQEKG